MNTSGVGDHDVGPHSGRGAKTKPNEGQSLESRLRESYSSLPASERKIADLMLDFPGEVAAYSATELAELAGGSKAAVTRLTQRLGFDSFEEARRTARDKQDWGSPVYLLSKGSEAEGFAANVERHFKEDIDAIKRTFDELSEETFEQIVKAICKAKRVWILGYRNSRYFAGYLRWQMIQVRGDVHLLPDAGETLAEYLCEINKGDLIIIVGFRRRVPEVSQALKWARESSVQTLFITDPSARSSNLSTWTVRCETRGSDLFDHYAAAMSFFHFLSVAIVARTGLRGRSRLARIEELHEEFSQFG